MSEKASVICENERSSVRCLQRFEEYAESHCEVSGAVLDVARVRSFLRKPKAVRDSVWSIPITKENLDGSLLVGCDLKHSPLWQESKFGWGGQKWLFHAGKSVEPTEIPYQHCNKTIDVDIYADANMWTGAQGGNPFHSFFGLFHAFHDYNGFRLSPEKTWVIALDSPGHEDGIFNHSWSVRPLGPLWQRAFSPNHRIGSLEDILAGTSEDG
eukprot:CAMPEP_0184680196 /NCGR_PEP_ID=MMETSP0312-20130426/3072_1 /TAXON_ID=31354 /ORGANISM="Compsopogon coeruleus, Strain SAG 36.94" /LENGTH=211 /DNA_ID=CAMNT_0027130145 /DNA_START=122 /DNA_END=753 /DNA_ORIENTATION=+